MVTVSVAIQPLLLTLSVYVVVTVGDAKGWAMLVSLKPCGGDQEIVPGPFSGSPRSIGTPVYAAVVPASVVGMGLTTICTVLDQVGLFDTQASDEVSLHWTESPLLSELLV